jgi:hypothetical protein
MMIGTTDSPFSDELLTATRLARLKPLQARRFQRTLGSVPLVSVGRPYGEKISGAGSGQGSPKLA